MRLLRLRGRKICDRVLRHGKVWKGRHLQIRWMDGPPRHPSVRTTRPEIYAGTTASTKLDKSAVKRNRMRRRCREALRLAVLRYDGLSSTQLLIAPRSSSLTVPFGALTDDIEAFLSTRPHGRREAR